MSAHVRRVVRTSGPPYWVEWLQSRFSPAGRNLYPSDTAREALIHETLVRKLGIRNPAQVVGKAMRSNGKDLQIVGVIKDFNQSSLHKTIDPLFMTTEDSSYYAANLHLQTGNFQGVIRQMETAFNQVYPDTYFSPQFVDEQIERSYRQEQTMAKLVNFFAGVAVLIGCLGLYGLVLFMITRKTKEIGVRKVLGASVGSILWLFGQEFSRLIVVAFGLAAPVAWYVMSHWLQSFQYRIKLGPGIFLIAILTTVVVAALTIGSQAIRAALMNPVKSLRSDKFKL